MTAASDLLRSDHRRIETHLDPLLDALLHLTPAAIPLVREHFNAIRRLATGHFLREEQVFYPRVRPLDPILLSRLDAQHEDTRLKERYLDELLASIPASPTERELTELHRLGLEFHDAVQTHIVDEEDHLLDFADQLLTEREQEELHARMDEISTEPRP